MWIERSHTKREVGGSSPPAPLRSNPSKMSPGTVVALSLISQATGLVSVLALYVASIGVPWKSQTWKGSIPSEVRHRKRQILMA